MGTDEGLSYIHEIIQGSEGVGFMAIALTEISRAGLERNLDCALTGNPSSLGRKHSPQLRVLVRMLPTVYYAGCAGMCASLHCTGCAGCLGENNVFGSHEATYRYRYHTKLDHFQRVRQH